jgi:hypothetical protein
MSELENIKINKREYWEEQVRRWKESNLNQLDFCRKTGIQRSTFGYWLSVLLKPKKESKNKFIPVKFIKPIPSTTTLNESTIKIKLSTGHLVYVPLEISMQEITKLIQSLGTSHD